VRPRRIQRQRTPGWQKPPHTVCVTRPPRTSRHWPGWGNRFIVGRDGTAAECVRLFEAYYEHDVDYHTRLRRELGGKNLACWCKLGDPCYADILLRWANAPATERQGESKLPHYGLVAEQPHEVWDLATHARQPGMVPRCAP
jgi:hypothetical protein